MKKLFFSLLIILLISPQANAAPQTSAQKLADIIEKCKKADNKPKQCRTRAKKKQIAKKKCEALTSSDEKEACLQELENKGKSKDAG